MKLSDKIDKMKSLLADYHSEYLKQVELNTKIVEADSYSEIMKIICKKAILKNQINILQATKAI